MITLKILLLLLYEKVLGPLLILTPAIGYMVSLAPLGPPRCQRCYSCQSCCNCWKMNFGPAALY